MRRLAPLLAGVLLALAACSDKPRITPEQAAAIAIEQARAAQQIAYKACIERVLQADLKAGSSADLTHTNAMRAIDTMACPPDFRAAYIDHIYAWEKQAQIQGAKRQINSQDNKNEVLVVAGLEWLFGTGGDSMRDFAAVNQQLDQMAVEADQKIRDTFQTVERIAVTYGAQLPTK